MSSSSMSKSLVQREEERVKGPGRSQDFSSVLYQLELSTERTCTLSVGVSYVLKVQLKLGSEFRKYLYLVIMWWEVQLAPNTTTAAVLPAHLDVNASSEETELLERIRLGLLDKAPLSCSGNLKTLSLSDM